jgi:hypothetical protein
MRMINCWILNVGTPKAVRRVPINGISLTGEILGQEFESSLERDLIYRMAWPRTLKWFQVQPVEIPYPKKDGQIGSYTPDLLVCFDNERLPMPQKPILCEVKYAVDLRSNWLELKPKFKAAQAYARSQGWRFKIYNERQIRTPFLENVKFLWSYQFAEMHDEHEYLILHTLNLLEPVSIKMLLDKCYRPENRMGRGAGLWTLWCLIARENVCCDLEVKLSLESEIWLNPALYNEYDNEEDC